MIRLIYIIIFFFLIFPNLIITKANPLKNEYDQKKILNFTRELISKSEYYRAFVEIKRLNSYYPKFLSNLQLYTTESYLYFNSGKYDLILGRSPEEVTSQKPWGLGGEAPYHTLPSASLQRAEGSFIAGASLILPKLFKVIPKEKDQIIKDVDKIYKFDAFISLNNNYKNKLPFDLKRSENKEFDSYFFKRELYWHLVRNRFDLLDSLYEKYPVMKRNEHKGLVDFARSESKKYKSPVMATILGLIPGMGYIYAGEYGTGIVSFLMVSVCTVITYFAVSTGNVAIGIMIGTIGTFFYTGSMAGGYFAARRYNQRISSYRDEFLQDELYFSEDREHVFNKYGIGKNAK